jgi:hypothetical protein
MRVIPNLQDILRRISGQMPDSVLIPSCDRMRNLCAGIPFRDADGMTPSPVVSRWRAQPPANCFEPFGFRAETMRTAEQSGAWSLGVATTAGVWDATRVGGIMVQAIWHWSCAAARGAFHEKAAEDFRTLRDASDPT